MSENVVARRARWGAWLGLCCGGVALMSQSLWQQAAVGDAAPRVPEVAAAASGVAPPEPVVRVLRDERKRAPMPQMAAGPATVAPPQSVGYAIPAAQIDPDRAQIVDGRLVQTLDDGAVVRFTLDPAIQRAAVDVMERFQVDYGAVVAIRPATGELLALAEHAEGRPELRHLTLQAEGPAASIFKIITAAALIERAGLTADSEICTHGGHRRVDLENLQDNSRLDTRCETLKKAFGASSNVAFARWADRLLTPADLQASADAFLFNQRLPFLWGVGVSKARIPTGSRIALARTAAGFTASTLSPLHAAVITGAVGNGGVMMAPRLIETITRDGETLYSSEAQTLGRALPPEVAAVLAEVMTGTTEGGTATKFFAGKARAQLGDMQIGAKTGHLTAQDTGMARHFSWFVAFAPAEAPEIAVAGLVVNGAEWRTKGVVLARAVLETWAERRGELAAAQR
jgi:peptidoglycan glycosyltransferase